MDAVQLQGRKVSSIHPEWRFHHPPCLPAKERFPRTWPSLPRFFLFLLITLDFFRLIWLQIWVCVCAFLPVHHTGFITCSSGSYHLSTALTFPLLKVITMNDADSKSSPLIYDFFRSSVFIGVAGGFSYLFKLMGLIIKAVKVIRAVKARLLSNCSSKWAIWKADLTMISWLIYYYKWIVWWTCIHQL